MEGNNKALRHLIQRVLDSGESTRSIADRAAAKGHPTLSHSQVHAYHRGLAKKAPSRQQIQALAAGLDVSEAEVQRAAFVEFWGYDPARGLRVDWLDSFDVEIRTFVRAAAGILQQMPSERRAAMIEELMSRMLRDLGRQ